MVGPDNSRDVQVVRCSREHRGTQALLYDRCFTSTAGGEVGAGSAILPWRYDANPHGEALSLLTLDCDGQGLAGYACSPRVVLSQGRESARVGQTGDVMSHPAHRGQGLFSDLDRRAMLWAAEEGWAHIFGLPNRQSAPIFIEHLGWQEVGAIRPYTFVLQANSQARAQRMRAGRMAALATPLRAWRGNMARGRLRDRAFAHVTSVAIPRFDESVVGLTAAVAKRYAWMVRRDHDYLNWRFIDAPSGLFRAHGVFDEGGELRGYCVVQLPSVSNGVGYVVDLVALDDVAWAGAMEAALGHLTKLGACVARVHALDGSDWMRRVLGCGFAPSKPDDFKPVIAYITDAGHPLAEAAKDPSRWFFTDGDRDDELVH